MKKSILLLFGLCFFFYNFLTNPLSKNPLNDLEKENIKGKVSFIEEMEYNSLEKNGKIEKGDLLDKQNYKYNDSGNITELNYIGIDIFGWKMTYIYNEFGIKIEGNTFDNNGVLVHKINYKFDQKGYLIEENYYSESIDDISHTYTYKYDDRGNMIEINYYISESGLYSKSTYNYDESGNRIEANYFNKDGVINTKATFKYDESGNLIETNSNYNNSITKRSFKYEFDNEGNWVVKYHFDDDDNPIFITERTIEYYP